MWRDDFPALKHTVNGKPLAFLDTAASAQKPQVVIDALTNVLSGAYANIHRGLYHNSQVTTTAFENVRAKVARFIGADSPETIVFTRNSTESINLVARAWGTAHLQAGDEVLLTEMEHHANLVPWQLLRDDLGIVLKHVPMTADGVLDVAAIDALVTPKTKLFAFVQVSNALGVINPAKEMIARARAINPHIKILIDASQSVVHGGVDVTDLDCDWLTWTGHKLYGPNGIGVLYGKPDALESMRPYQGGGDMIETVTLQHSTYKHAPYRFEAGTPPIAETIALGAAIDYVSAIGLDAIADHETKLTRYMLDALRMVPALRLYAPDAPRVGVASFTIAGCHTADVAMILDKCGVAVRTGHHCCMPLMARLGISGTVRASLGLYSNQSDIDQLIDGLSKARRMLAAA